MTSADGKYSADLKMDADRESGFRVGTASGDVLTFRYDFQPGTWYYIAWTQDKAAGLTMYVNGTKIGVTNTWTKMHDVVAPIDVIGGPGFTGLIDEVKIYKRVLSDTEMRPAGMLLPGLNLAEHETDMYIGGTYTIVANLQGGDGDGTVAFESSDPTIAKVDASGTVTGVSRGTAVITVRGGGFTDMVTVNVSRELTIREHAAAVQARPDEGHGRAQVTRHVQPVLRPARHDPHEERPSDHLVPARARQGTVDHEDQRRRRRHLDAQDRHPRVVGRFAGDADPVRAQPGDGTERIMMITACPGWGTDSAGNRYGWNTSYSDDNGETWTEYRHRQFDPAGTYDNANNDAIVAMASLVQLKDSDGNDIQKWMGVYHNYAYVNFRTYLTFDENGDEQWSESEPYLAQWRSIESAVPDVRGRHVPFSRRQADHRSGAQPVAQQPGDTDLLR